MAASVFSSEVSSFADLEEDFLRLTGGIVWCAVATVDESGRPRSRVMHVAWRIEDGVPVGRVSTSPSPTKTAHLARNPHVSCTYWSPAHDVVFADCRTAWVADGPEKAEVWVATLREAAEHGQDSYAVWPGGAQDPAFQVLRLEPWRVQITLQDLAAGKPIGSSRVWHADQRVRSAVTTR